MTTNMQAADAGGTGARPIGVAVRLIERRLDLTRPSTSTRTLDRATMLRAIEGAAQAIGIKEGEFATLRVLILSTRDGDWEAGATLMAWPSNQYLASTSGKCVSTIKNRVRRLRELGLVQMRDSANCKRRGSRSRSGGIIVEAYGFDLSPLRARYDELLERGARYKVETDMLRTGQRRLSATCRLVGQVMAQAAEAALTGPEWPALRTRLDIHIAEAHAARKQFDVVAFDMAIDAADCVRKDAIELADRLIYGLDSDPMGSENWPHIHLQTDPAFMSVQAIEERSRFEKTAPAKAVPSNGGSPSTSPSIKTDPNELVELFPAAAAYVHGRHPDWDDACRGAASMSRDLGIRRATYIEAVSLLGREGAALAIFVTAERNARNEIRLTPGCYFAGITERARQGTLHLGRTLWGFRRGSATGVA